VLGIHIIGPLATEILSEAAAVLHLEGTIDDMMRHNRRYDEHDARASHGVGGHGRRVRLRPRLADQRLVIGDQ